MNKNLCWNTHGKHYIKVWSSKLLAIIWLRNIINTIYFHFWLPRIKKGILWNANPQKYNLQWCSVGQARTKVEVFLSWQKRGKLNSKNCWRAFPLAGLEVFKTFEFLRTLQIKNWNFCRTKNFKKNMKIIGWPYKVPLKSSTGVNWRYKFKADRLSIV